MSNFLRSHQATRGRHPNDHEKHYFGPDWAAPEADFKPFLKTIVLVATLIATVTFAAAFTMPCGFDTSSDNLGVATLVKKVALKPVVAAVVAVAGGGEAVETVVGGFLVQRGIPVVDVAIDGGKRRKEGGVLGKNDVWTRE
ncbi:hypothetical protein Vadar_001301 [Vaccinium darrowii]|uniref:Uncharacterized protein n=1 Tax=Vaccinium darrowii TaxID=229202 RepID=A0ACB7XN45_9ERIC|nr:hypothetical protein Vadar_001301 [Vaccinium darrowii]